MSPFSLSPTLSPPLSTFLFLTPLLSSTASLTHAYMEYLTVSSFLHPPPTTSRLARTMARVPPGTPLAPPSPTYAAALRRATETLAPAWFVNFFSRGVRSVVGLNAVTVVSGGVGFWMGGRGGEAWKWYAAGVVGAVGHYAFVPGVAGAVERLFGMCVGERTGEGESKEGEEEGEGEAKKAVREWVGWHVTRMATVDVFAWGAFLVGGVMALTEG